MTGKKLLILGLSWPEPKATAAGVRMMQLIHTFIQNGWELTFASTAEKTKNGADLEALGITFQAIRLNDESFDEFLEELKPDVVLFDRFITEEQYGWRVAEKAPGAIRLLDTEDLHSLRHARKQALEQNIPFRVRAWISLEETKRELASIYRCDLTLIISKEEIKLLEDKLQVPGELLLYLPLWAEGDYRSTGRMNSFSSRKGFIFIGNGKHLPNIDAINYLRESLWPLIRELIPTANVNIYGAYLSENIKSLHSPELGFHVHGYVDNAHMAMQQARVNLVPRRFGAGLKGKLILAFENGTPSITTTVGAEGLLDQSVAEKFIFDQPEKFAKEAVMLYQNEKEWSVLQAIGFDVLEARFNGEYYQKLLLSALEQLSEGLDVHRSRNFIGAMLQHHTLQSTKYMSRWISCKNKLNALQ